MALIIDNEDKTKLEEIIYRILAEETYTEAYESPIYGEQVRHKMKYLANKIAGQLEAVVKSDITEAAEIDNVIVEIMVEDGPDGHCDGHEIITSFIMGLLEGRGKEWADRYKKIIDGEKQSEEI